MYKNMLYQRFLLIFFIFFSFQLFGQNNFDKFFTSATLRFDYNHVGDFKSEYFYPVQLKKEPFWGGTKINLIDEFNYGEYRIMIYDSASNQLIYSKGFSSLFYEWKTTIEAKTETKSFYETQIIPFPKQTIILEIQTRNKKDSFELSLKKYINPTSKFVVNENPQKFNSIKVHYSGNSAEMVDIVFIPEGYTKDELKKLRDDMNRFSRYLFNSSPYKENKDKFNIWAIEAFSEESGTDLPDEKIWKNTIANSSFSTFDSERYLMTYDIKTVRDIAANVPYDQIYIIVNSKKYGGGAIYNYYNCCSADNELSEFVFIHELGHGFAGLADEYYDSQVSFTDFFSQDIEPWSPNLTTLKNFDSKWKNMMDKNTAIPTLVDNKNYNIIGVYEGGGYVSKGVYRPYINCSMHTAIVDGFCPVCKRAIQKMIDFYTK